jgi:hypothetical protein
LERFGSKGLVHPNRRLPPPDSPVPDKDPAHAWRGLFYARRSSRLPPPSRWALTQAGFDPGPPQVSSPFRYFGFEILDAFGGLAVSAVILAISPSSSFDQAATFSPRSLFVSSRKAAAPLWRGFVCRGRACVVSLLEDASIARMGRLSAARDWRETACPVVLFSGFCCPGMHSRAT